VTQFEGVVVRRIDANPPRAYYRCVELGEDVSVSHLYSIIATAKKSVRDRRPDVNHDLHSRTEDLILVVIIVEFHRVP
jgi:DNA-binding HxlR family transcriptional regulator